MNVKSFSRANNFFKLDPTQTEQPQWYALFSADEIIHHLQLGDARKNRIIGEMAVKPA